MDSLAFSFSRKRKVMVVNNSRTCYSFHINPSFTDCPIGKSPFTCWCLLFSLLFCSPIVSDVMHQLQDKESVFSTWLHGKQFFSLIASFLSLFPLSSFCPHLSLSLSLPLAVSAALQLFISASSISSWHAFSRFSFLSFVLLFMNLMEVISTGKSAVSSLRHSIPVNDLISFIFVVLLSCYFFPFHFCLR